MYGGVEEQCEVDENNAIFGENIKGIGQCESQHDVE